MASRALEFGELFSGPGGMALGLKEAGFTPLWAVDYDEWACKTYANNIGAHAIRAKVEAVDFRELPTPGGLVFGFPCNDFSVVGEKQGTNGYFGKLYKHAVDAVADLQPKWFIAENVPGLMSSGGRGILSEFSTAGAGYSVAIHLYKFEDYGVPQRRWRIVAVGIRQDMEITFLPPAPTHAERHVSVGEALRGADLVPHNNELTRHHARVIEMLSHIPPGGNAWHPDVPTHLQLNVPSCRISLIYRRLEEDQPAYTVTGSGGGGTHMYHFAEPRALTNRERARLQTFPDDFVFEGPKEAVRKQIGMAVPPAGAHVIGKALHATLRGKPYEHVAPSEGHILPSEVVEQPALAT